MPCYSSGLMSRQGSAPPPYPFARRRGSLPTMQPHELPVYQQRDRIVEALGKSQVVVVESPTGSGKTTQLPVILMEAGFAQSGVIGITQPRRIAAVSVSEFIARQLDTEVGGRVGYKMRFADKTSPSTVLKIMTDGILLQEMKLDYSLATYSCIVVDEAHERSLNIDFILGLLKRVLRDRPEFRVIVSSATINAEVFSEYFDSCPIVRIDTPMYPVQVIYDTPRIQSDPDELVAKITEVVGRIVREEREGDVLIFLGGEKLIKDCIASLYMEPYREQLHLLPLYGRLSKEEQESVFLPAPKGKRKIIVSTNIAETSVTIDGITTVIDSGLSKMNFYNPRTFTSSLIEGPISKASANQRRGRAGRTQPGSCYRLYRRDEYERRALFTTEEIYRTDLSEVVLRMAEIGITDFQSFDFLSSPGREGIAGAVESLQLLEALEADNTLSPIGEMMADFPLLPRHSRMIVEAIRVYPNVIDEVVTAASFLTTNSPFLLPMGEEMEARQAHHRYRDDLGDFVSYLKLLAAYREAGNKEKFCESRYLDTRTMAEIDNVQRQLAEIVGETGVPVLSGGSMADYLCAVAKGLIQFVCVQSGRGSYRSLTAERILIHPGSVMFRESPRFIVAGEVVRTSRTYARSVSLLHESWIRKISPLLADSLLHEERSGAGDTRQRDQGKGHKKETARRDTTSQVRIGTRFFPIQSVKGGKKSAVIDWDHLVLTLKDNPVVHEQLHSLKGKLVHRDMELLSGTRVSEIMRIAPHINPHRDFVGNSWPQSRSFASGSEGAELCQELPLILKMTRRKKSGKSVGFLTLQTDGNGIYWFKPARSFHVAVAESLSALDQLADELAKSANQPEHELINQTYRRLAELLEE
jgi:ATP-dependent RNA helicase HrpA